jgi:hypothetical protein
MTEKWERMGSDHELGDESEELTGATNGPEKVRVCRLCHF